MQQIPFGSISSPCLQCKEFLIWGLWYVYVLDGTASLFLPSLFIPMARHFWQRQYWQRFLWRLSTRQSLLSLHVQLRSFLTVRLKKPLQPSQLYTPQCLPEERRQSHGGGRLYTIFVQFEALKTLNLDFLDLEMFKV